MPEYNQCGSWYLRGRHKLGDAETSLKRKNYSESISTSQESIEFSIKAMFSYYDVDFQKTHKLKEQTLKSLYDKIPQEFKEKYNFPRIFLLSIFWSEFYLQAKYGFEEFKIGSDALFEKGEADLALQHARECQSACLGVINF